MASHAAIFYGQFTGEDEALQWHTCRRILAALGGESFWQALRSIANILVSEYHPPFRFLMSLPGVVLWPNLEIGLRTGAVIGSAVMTGLLALVGFRLGGTRCAMLTALLVAASGVYTWTSMAFSWSWLTAFLTAALLLLWDPARLDINDKSNNRYLWVIFACLGGAYLVNSGAILFSVGLVLALMVRNWRRWPRLMWVGLPVALMYGLYWLVFLILPPQSGQWMQTSHRAGMGKWNVSSFIENLMGWNAYGFPLLFNLLWMAGLVMCARRRPHLLWILAPFTLAWSVWLHGQSHQYFLLGTLPLIPFGVYAFREKLRGFWRPALLVAMIFSWNFFLFLKPYEAGQGRYQEVHPWLGYGLGYAGRYHNAVEPWADVAQTLSNAVIRGETWVTDIDGPFGIFYFPGEPGFVGRLGSKKFPIADIAQWKIRPDWILTRRNLECPGVEKPLRFQGSALRLYRLQ